VRITSLPELKIAQIKPGMRGIAVAAKVVWTDDVREVKTKFGPARVSWVVLEDETGSIRLNLWRQQIDEVRVGDTVRLVNAFVRVYRDEFELNIGSDGRIEVLEHGLIWK
jgi:replication factor A1